MMSCLNKGRERGIALLVVLFALLLLSVIGLGMMYSTNLESAINSNYRDKQSALYAALGGIQEGRDRLRSSTPAAITPPSGLPGFVATASAGSAGVIYIVADNTVDPTDSGNTYFDSELCQERVLSLTGTAGVPCTAPPSPPSGQTWYRSFIYNNAAASAPWNLTTPLDLKWIRMTVKGNNMTPVATNGSSSTSTQVCWDGTHQIINPGSGYTNCTPNASGSVSYISLTTAGTYATQPTVTVSASTTGTTATAHVTGTTTTSGGQVITITVNTAGTGYSSSSPPTVTLDAPPMGGTQATATANVSPLGYPVQSISLTAAGTTQCFPGPSAPTLTFSAPASGSTATATIALQATASCIYSWAPTVHCGSDGKNRTYSSVNLNNGGGSNFSGTFYTDNGAHETGTASIQNAGSGYTSAPTQVKDGQSSRPDSGSPSLSGTCSATVTPNVTLGYLLDAATLTLTSGGSNYTTAPAITFSAPGIPAVTALATAVLSTTPSPGGGAVTSFNITNPGALYLAAPAVTIAAPGSGTTATATATINSEITTYTVTGVVLDNVGSGYTAVPTVSFGGGGGSGATAQAALNRGATTYGKVYLLTALGQTRTGARAMAQMEVASPVQGWAASGALTVDGPNPDISALPNSTNFTVNGKDSNSCSETADPDHPAADGFDDPNANPPTSSVQTITNAIPTGTTDHYVGTGGTPSVQNGYDAMGESLGTPLGLQSLTNAIKSAAQAEGHCCDGVGTHFGFGSGPNCTSSPSSCISYTVPGVTPTQTMNIPKPSATTTVVDFVEGNLDLSGSTDGYGILFVTGKLTMSGNFKWYGLVFVIGDGDADLGGGGNGKVVGSALIAKIYPNLYPDHSTLLSSLGSPKLRWNGGGGNGIQFDHCWSSNLMGAIPWAPPDSTRPLKSLSFRILPY